MATVLTHLAGEGDRIDGLPADWRDFVALTKPGVLRLVVFTGLCGLLAAPGHVHPVIALTAILCIALGAGAAGALNQWYEADLDAKMKRTRNRPLPAGRMEPDAALQFGVGVAVASVVLMGLAVNALAAAILGVSILFYVVVYTMWLKRRTPQNIVIGGAAGAFPALIGWAAATGRVDALPILLFLQVFLWTPPHFWALSLFVNSDYAAAGVPMMSVVAGQRSTRLQAFLYSLPMAAVAVAPWPMGLVGPIYGVAAVLLNIVFVVLAARVGFSGEPDATKMRAERRLFGYSILYLFASFGMLVVDRLLA
ncbi:heme o synthase [Sphingomonas sp.]|uniref:heme o synthase n=1 Tax=Sphingomonas sp. TaxID=28214 RepID=UPI003AFFE056